MGRFSLLPGVVALLCIGLVNCSGSGIGLDQSGQPIRAGGSGTGGPVTADFDSIQANVFTPICSVCHSGASAPQGLRLDAGNSYALLVGIPSTEVPTILRVDPGNPSNSYIIQKLKGIAAVGGQMPLGEAPLPAATIEAISQWISNGAPPSASADAADFQLAALAPDDGDVLAENPGRLIVAFTRPIDPGRISSQSFRLQQISEGSAATNEEDIAIEVTTVPANPQTVIITPHSALSSGSYRLLIDADARHPLFDIYGRALRRGAGIQSATALVSTFSVDVSP
jgi:hypothetical protein